METTSNKMWVTREVRKKLLRSYIENLWYDFKNISYEKKRELENTQAFQLLLQSTITWVFWNKKKKSFIKMNKKIIFFILCFLIWFFYWYFYYKVFL